jgi:two-component system, cell cycle sensor histidine kinase and response regulator CckA
LRHAQKMEAVGQLAGGVAHDFGNLITAILGYADLLLRAMPGDDARRADVQEIRNTAARAGSLTRQLLAYSRRQILTPQVIDLNALVTEMATMLRRVIGEDIILTTVASTAAARVRADPGQIEQVILNLAVNARDAMPDGGRLTIETVVLDVDEERTRRSPPPQPATTPGPSVRLVVRDSGVGMDARTKAHLFEPFFTTKEPGKGTGLGLATVYGIVQQSEHDAAAAVIDLARGSETLLLVEDEPAVRTPSCDILRESGYHVHAAASGEEALRLLAAPDAPHPDLLITDVVMPMMKGPELAGRVRDRFPVLPVLFTSGYANSPNMAEWLARPRTSFLQKPFTPEELARRVRDILDAV